MFLFTDESTLAASTPLDVEWVSGKGELVRLTDQIVRRAHHDEEEAL